MHDLQRSNIVTNPTKRKNVRFLFSFVKHQTQDVIETYDLVFKSP